MKKALIIAVVILLCVSTLFGCGNSASQINVGAQMSNYTEAASDEDSETNPLITALLGSEQEKEAPFSRNVSKWRLFLKISDSLYVLSKQKNGRTIYSPLVIHSFQFLRPRKLTDAEKFNIQYPNPDKLTTTADKLRYYRYKKSLLQREVAEYAGINESTYIHYENLEHDYYPVDKLSRIAKLLEVDVTDLLDEYNRFLYDGQGWQIRKIRKSMGLTQYQFGKLYGVSTGAVKRWESGKVRMTKGTWEKLIISNSWYKIKVK